MACSSWPRTVAAALSIFLSGTALAAAPNAQDARRARPRAESSQSQARALFAQRQRVAAATVTLPAKSCAGSVAGSPTQVLTAAHCIPEGAEETDVVFRGRRLRAVVALIDRTRDTALLALDEPLDVVPLELGLELPRPGDPILFVGRVDRPSRPQVEKVVRLGRCPSLPGVSDAVFTNLNAKPGDSGAPIVDVRLRIVGVIHGGAACHIAASTAELARKLSAAGRRKSSPPVPAPASFDSWGESASRLRPEELTAPQCSAPE